jgi:hypothetical protein
MLKTRAFAVLAIAALLLSLTASCSTGSKETSNTSTSASPGVDNTSAVTNTDATGVSQPVTTAEPNSNPALTGRPSGEEGNTEKTASTRSSAGTRRSTTAGSRRAYYNYEQPKKRSFVEKHRDKLTVAGTGVGGAIIGGLIGGKKGAAIGGLSGAGAGALYTYKIRKKKRTQ